MRFREYQAEAHSTSRRLVVMFVFTIALTVAGVNAALWLAWRLLAGVASAWVLVMITGLSQPLAIAAGRPRLGALVFAGPGLGIVLPGLLALGSNLRGKDSATLWLV